MRVSIALVVALFVVLSACGGGADEDGTDEETQAPGSLLTVVGLDERFQPRQMEASAGPVTITFDNQDEGVLHNIRFYEGSNADGRFIRKTELERGLDVQTLQLDLRPGTYFYDCEVHPAGMTGTLVIR